MNEVHLRKIISSAEGIWN